VSSPPERADVLAYIRAKAAAFSNAASQSADPRLAQILRANATLFRRLCHEISEGRHRRGVPDEVVGEGDTTTPLDGDER